MYRLLRSVVSAILIGATLLASPFSLQAEESITVNALTAAAPASQEISVYIDGKLLSFDVAPIAVDGRVLVPMRRIFEYMGATVEWVQETKVVKGTCGLQTIMMQLGNKKMKINNDYLILDVVPQAINGRTLVPLRAVAEALQATVQWDGDTKSVHITTKYPYSQYVTEEPFDKYHIRTSRGDYEYVDLLLEGNKFTVKGHFGDGSIEMASVAVGARTLDDKFTTRLYKGKDFSITLDLTEENTSATRLPIYVWLKNINESKSYYNYLEDRVSIIRDGDDYYFEEPLVHENNRNFTDRYNNPIAYMNPSVPSELVALSNEICQNCDSDYRKLIAIYDWVADNIYYNHDHYNDRSKPCAVKALDVYKTKNAICTGYANLTLALVQAQGIPCRKVRGYSNGYGVDDTAWQANAPTITTTNHVWNQAYVDNRWVNMDTTWGSYNQYRNGQFEAQAQNGRIYFDCSDVFMAYTHKHLISVLS